MFTLFFSVCAARYLKGETETAMIISEAGDEVAEPFGVAFLLLYIIIGVYLQSLFFAF